MKETRIITQVKVWGIVLNMMRNNKVETKTTVALGYDKDELIEWYNNQLADKVWMDEVEEIGGFKTYSKTFRKGSDLEWFNPAQDITNITGGNAFGHGISSNWIDEKFIDNLAKLIPFIGR